MLITWDELFMRRPEYILQEHWIPKLIELDPWQVSTGIRQISQYVTGWKPTKPSVESGVTHGNDELGIVSSGDPMSPPTATPPWDPSTRVLPRDGLGILVI